MVNHSKPSLVYALFVFFAALSISAVAAYYSIVGLMALFSGAVVAIAIMGSVLEIGKLVTASWLYRNWQLAPRFLKLYLTLAVVVLMFITSMGIFGFLSKAHLSQVNPVGDTSAKVERIEFSISQTEAQKERALHTLGLLDQALEEYYKHGYISKALRKRAEQTEEREALQAEVKRADQEIDKLNAEKFELKSELRSFEAEVGPVKYIAELIYGEEKAKDLLDEAVRAVIIILIFVFDPLAVLLVIAGTMTLQQVDSSAEKPQKSEKKKPTKTLPKNEKKEIKIKEVIKEIPVEKIVEKEVIKEVPVEKIVEVIKEVPANIDSAKIEEIASTALENLSGNTRIIDGSVRSLDLDTETKKLFKKELRKVLAERKL